MEMIDLISKARKGNKDALIQLIMDKKDEYYRLAFSYVGNKEDSLDALQDMILILFDNIKKLREPDSFYSWSKTILVNVCKTRIRKRNKIILLDSNDDNVMEVFCKYENLKEYLNASSLYLRISGIKPFGYKGGSGSGKFTEDKRNCFFVHEFEPPEFYEKWMKINIRYIKNGLIEEKSIGFTLDRNKALNKTVEKSLKKKVTVGDYTIIFDKITASKMSTYVKGRLEGLTDSAREVMKDKPPIDPNGEHEKGIPIVNFDISTDKGESVEIYGSGMNNSFEKASFTYRGDAIPEKFKSLEIKNIRLESNMIVDKRVDISVGEKETNVNDDLIIKKVYYEGENTCVVVSSKGIPAMGIMDGDEFMDMVNPQIYDREAESQNAVDRVYRFKGKGKNMKLEIKCINYSIFSDEVLEIPD